MDRAPKPYVQVVIDDVDTVVYDPEGSYDADIYDRYATFEQARDAALCCIEYLLEEGTLAGDGRVAALESMLGLLESAHTFDDLDGQAEYRRLVMRLDSLRPAAA